MGSLLIIDSGTDAILEDTLRRVLPQVLVPLLQDIKDSLPQLEENIAAMSNDVTAMKSDLVRVCFISALVSSQFSHLRISLSIFLYRTHCAPREIWHP